MLRSGPEALAWVDRELALAAERRLANRDSVQPFIDACVIAATFLEGGGVTDGRMELYATLALELINVRDKLRSRLFTPTEPGKGDKGLTGDQARFRAWAGCASIAIAADGSGVTAADHQAAMATQWLVEDDDMTARVGGPLGDGGVQKARLRIVDNAKDDKIAQFARGIAEVAALVPAETRAKWFLDQLAKGGHAYGL